MGGIPIADRFRAARLVAQTHFRPTDDLRVTPIKYRLVRHLTAGEVPGWIDFDHEPDVPRQVGLVALNRDDLMDQMEYGDGTRLGLMRAVGGAVVYGALPRHGLPQADLDRWSDFMFGVELGADPLPVVPVLRSPDGSMRIPDANVKPLGVAALEAVPGAVRVY